MARSIGEAQLLAWVLPLLNGHLLQQVQPQVWGAELFRFGLWVALPTLAMQVFSIGFSLAIAVGLFGLLCTPADAAGADGDRAGAARGTLSALIIRGCDVCSLPCPCC
jgi:hypothetical protein